MSDADKATGGPAEAAQSASSSPSVTDASTTPANGDGGDKGKGGNGGKGGKGAGGGGIPQPTRSAAIREFVINLAPLLIFALVALAFVLSLVSIFWPYIAAPPRLDKTLLQLLADTETARGLITFLVALSTVAIAVILIVYLASSGGSRTLSRTASPTARRS